MSSRFLYSVDDLSPEEVEAILGRARDLEAGAPPRAAPSGATLALLFLSPSLRTRLGFAAAASRLGASHVDVLGTREGAGMSGPESLSDTLRATSGMADAVILRTPFRLDRDAIEAAAAAPCVNGGDGDGEHPTQALIDLYAIERAKGPVGNLAICVCGDLSTRVVRSLLRLFCRFPPRELLLAAPAGREEAEIELPEPLASRTRRGGLADAGEADVVYMAGLPERNDERRLDGAARADFSLTPDRLGQLRSDSVVLSPMPVVDEIAETVRSDPRVGIFEQSDRGLHVRVALLETLLS